MDLALKRTLYACLQISLHLEDKENSISIALCLSLPLQILFGPRLNFTIVFVILFLLCAFRKKHLSLMRNTSLVFVFYIESEVYNKILNKDFFRFGW